MSLECLYKDIEYCRFRTDKSEEYTCEANLIVPDTKGDIAKVLSVKSLPVISDTKTEQDRILISGTIKFSVIYLSEDETESISTITTSVPFSHIITASGITEEFISLVSLCSSNCAYSLINSRRLKVTSFVKFISKSYKNTRLKALSQAKGAETKQQSIPFFAARVVSNKNITVTATTELPPGSYPICEILNATSTIADSDQKVLNNKLIVKGNITTDILYKHANGISDASVSVPFTEIVEADGMAAGFDSKISISVSDCLITPSTDISGENRMLDITFVLSVTILSFTKEENLVITDIYIPRSTVKLNTDTVISSDPLHLICEDDLIKETISLSQGQPSIYKILDIICSLGEFSLNGNSSSSILEVTILYLSDDNSVNTFSSRIPISHKFTGDNISNPTGLMKHFTYNISGSDKVDIRMNLQFCADIYKTEKTAVFTSCSQEDAPLKARPSIIVSFVKHGDSLWDIAKKYNIPLSALASANALDENAILTIGEKLIIPR